MIHAIKEIASPQIDADHQRSEFEQFKKNLFLLFEREKPANQKALKILHKPEDARDYELAEERLRKEITAMAEASHSNLLKIEDYDLDSKWYVSSYYQKGSLSNHLNIFAGNFPKALKAFRPLVEGVAELHEQNWVHRDIKPQNIFLDDDSNLVLGDFGLIFFKDDEKTRISETLENVGSHDWMPGWALNRHMPIEDIKPVFDVFSLCKVLWSMVSGQPVLALWYFEEPDFNVESQYDNNKFIKFANPLFKKCIVEKEDNCLPNASALLEEVDKTLAAIESDADKIDPNTKRKCKVCGLGEYQMIVDESNFGLGPREREFKIFTCSYCGNVQLFSYDREIPDAWRSLK